MWLLILLSWINQRKQKLNLKLRCFGGKWNTQLLIFLALTIPATSRGPAKDNSIKPCIFVDLSIWAWPQLYILWGRTLCTLGLRPLKILIESTMCSVSNSGKAFLETTLGLRSLKTPPVFLKQISCVLSSLRIPPIHVDHTAQNDPLLHGGRESDGKEKTETSCLSRHFHPTEPCPTPSWIATPPPS